MSAKQSGRWLLNTAFGMRKHLRDDEKFQEAMYNTRMKLPKATQLQLFKSTGQTERDKLCTFTLERVEKEVANSKLSDDAKNTIITLFGIAKLEEVAKRRNYHSPEHDGATAAIEINPVPPPPEADSVELTSAPIIGFVRQLSREILPPVVDKEIDNIINAVSPVEVTVKKGKGKRSRQTPQPVSQRAPKRAPQPLPMSPSTPDSLDMTKLHIEDMPKGSCRSSSKSIVVPSVAKCFEIGEKVDAELLARRVNELSLHSIYEGDDYCGACHFMASRFYPSQELDVDSREYEMMKAWHVFILTGEDGSSFTEWYDRHSDHDYNDPRVVDELIFG